MEGRIAEITKASEASEVKAKEEFQLLSDQLKETEAQAEELQGTALELEATKARELELVAKFTALQEEQQQQNIEMEGSIAEITRTAEVATAKAKEELRLVIVQMKEAQREAQVAKIIAVESIDASQIREAELTARLSELQTQLDSQKGAMSRSAGVDERVFRGELEEILLLLQETKEKWHEDRKRFEDERSVGKDTEARLLSEIEKLKEVKSLESISAGPEPTISTGRSLEHKPLAARLPRTKAPQIPRHSNEAVDTTVNEEKTAWDLPPAGICPDDEPPISNLMIVNTTPQRDNRSNVGKLALHLAEKGNANMSTIDYNARAMSDVTVSEAGTGIVYDLPRLAAGCFPPTKERVSSTPPRTTVTTRNAEESSIASDFSILSPPALSATAVVTGLPEPTPIRPTAVTSGFPPRASVSPAPSLRPLELVSKLKGMFDEHQEPSEDDDEDSDLSNMQRR